MMNLWAELEGAILGEQPDPTPVRTQDQVVKRIAQLQQEAGRGLTKLTAHPKRWLSSQHFVLMTVPVAKLQNPVQHTPKYPVTVQKLTRHWNAEPLVIDAPPAAQRVKTETWILDGKHRARAAKITGRKMVQAWVGTEAIPGLLSDQNTGQWWDDYKAGKR